jgi:hypothetical protein
LLLVPVLGQQNGGDNVWAVLLILTVDLTVATLLICTVSLGNGTSATAVELLIYKVGS